MGFWRGVVDSSTTSRISALPTEICAIRRPLAVRSVASDVPGVPHEVGLVSRGSATPTTPLSTSTILFHFTAPNSW